MKRNHRENSLTVQTFLDAPFFPLYRNIIQREYQDFEGLSGISAYPAAFSEAGQ